MQCYEKSHFTPFQKCEKSSEAPMMKKSKLVIVKDVYVSGVIEEATRQYQKTSSIAEVALQTNKQNNSIHQKWRNF